MDSIFYFLQQYFMYIVYAILIIFILRRIFKKRIPNYHSHFNTLLVGNYSALDFYEQLTTKLSEAEVHGLSFSKSKLPQNNLGFTKRKYLKIEFQEYQFLVSACTFGKHHFFISYWGEYKTAVAEQLLRMIPFGYLLANRIYRITYYKHDTCSSFLTLLHEKVSETIKETTEAKGTSIDIPKPILKDFFKR